jgi:dTDP-4-amino-4,6-dideoxygalactose transaminase
MIPFVDLKAQYFAIKEEIDSAIQRVILNATFIGGEEVRRFEDNFAAWLGISHFIGCANGTDSIEILLKAMGVGPGDEVIVPALSWISTSEAVSNVGATPVFVDIHPDYYTIDEDLIEAAITHYTKAIIPVHLYGQPCNMNRIMEIADKYDLKVLEDCAQAHGATWNGQKVGTFGHCSSFSFFPGKNLGAYGDAGGMATGNPELAQLARMIANHGQLTKHEHLIEGRNSRLDGLQAAILNVKLNYLGEWIEKRIMTAEYYNQNLKDLPDIIVPKVRMYARHCFHLYVILCKNRDNLKDQLREAGVECFVHYPTALPFLPCYRKKKFLPENFPVSAMQQSKILSLPIYPELDRLQVNKIINSIYEASEI